MNALKRLIGYRRMARIRGVLNRMTRGRVGLYSTAEHYSTGPSAKVLRYYQYDGSKQIECPTCGWVGRGDDGSQELYRELFDVRCPQCDTMLFVVGYPTLAEIEDAAKRGNEEARRELMRINELTGGS
jgi:hypothetical protein